MITTASGASSEWALGIQVRTRWQMEMPFLFEAMYLGKGFREQNDEQDHGLKSVVGQRGGEAGGT